MVSPNSLTTAATSRFRRRISSSDVGGAGRPGHVDHGFGQQVQRTVRQPPDVVQGDGRGHLFGVGLGHQEITARGRPGLQVGQRHRWMIREELRPRPHQFLSTDVRQQHNALQHALLLFHQRGIGPRKGHGPLQVADVQVGLRDELGPQQSARQERCHAEDRQERIDDPHARGQGKRPAIRPAAAAAARSGSWAAFRQRR